MKIVVKHDIVQRITNFKSYWGEFKNVKVKAKIKIKSIDKKDFFHLGFQWGKNTTVATMETQNLAILNFMNKKDKKGVSNTIVPIFQRYDAIKFVRWFC